KNFRMDEEDVIFSGSPLAEYLSSEGVSDVSTSRPTNEPLGSADEKHENGQLGSRCPTLIDKLSYWFRWSQNVVLGDDSRNKQVLLHTDEILKHFHNSGLLLEDLGDTDDITTEEDSRTSSKFHSRSIMLWIGCFGCILGLAPTLLQTNGLFPPSQTIQQIGGTISVTVATTTFIPLGLRYWKNHRLKRLGTVGLRILETFFINVKNYCKVLERIIKLTVELQLIKRGFSLQSVKSGATNQGDTGILFDLRQHLHSSVNRVIEEQLLYLDELMKVLPNNKDVNTVIDTDPLIMYIMNSVREESFRINQEKESKITLQSLKKLNNCMNLVFSATAQKLASSFYSNRTNTPSILISLNYLHKLSLICDTLHTQFKSLETDYKIELYKFLQPNLMTARKSEVQPLHGVCSSIHALELRLMSSLTKVRNLQEDLDNVNTAEDLLIPIEDSCEVIKAELECCVAFHSMLEADVNKLSNTDTVDNIQPDDPLTIPTPGVPTKVTLLPAEAPLEVDQVWVGYTDDVIEPGDGNHGDGLMLLSEEERIARKREKETAKYMLSELRSVIVPRAAEMNKRESKALKLKNLTKDGTDNSVTNIEDLNNLLTTINYKPKCAKDETNGVDDGEATSPDGADIYDKENNGAIVRDERTSQSAITESPDTSIQTHSKMAAPSFETGTEKPTSKFEEQNHEISNTKNTDFKSHVNTYVDQNTGESDEEDLNSRTNNQAHFEDILSQGCFSFTANIAKAAAMRSQVMNMTEETFGSDSSDSEQ
ncbi:unnamed protein product, partial [Owenia fusiformis]